MANEYVEYAISEKKLELETVAGFDSKLGRVTWGLCAPGGGDTLLDFCDHLTPDEQEWLANTIAAAFPSQDD